MANRDPFNAKCLLVVALLVMSCSSQVTLGQSSWFERVSRITPGESTKEDLEKLFESPRFEITNRFKSAEQGIYNTKWGRIFVNYSLGKCEPDSDDVDFPVGTVLYFSFTPLKPRKISGLKLNLGSFRVEKEYDSPNIHYTHANGGLTLTTVNGRLTHVISSLTRAQIQRASCP